MSQFYSFIVLTKVWSNNLSFRVPELFRRITFLGTFSSVTPLLTNTSTSYFTGIYRVVTLSETGELYAVFPIFDIETRNLLTGRSPFGKNSSVFLLYLIKFLGSSRNTSSV